MRHSARGTAAPSAYEVERQTAEAYAFLRAACGVCGVPHSDELHEAVLRVRVGVVLPPIEAEPVRTTRAGFAAGVVVLEPASCSICGEGFDSLNAKTALHCPKCKPGAITSKVLAYQSRRRERRQNRGNGTATTHDAD